MVISAPVNVKTQEVGENMEDTFWIQIALVVETQVGQAPDPKRNYVRQNCKTGKFKVYECEDVPLRPDVQANMTHNLLDILNQTLEEERCKLTFSFELKGRREKE